MRRIEEKLEALLLVVAGGAGIIICLLALEFLGLLALCLCAFHLPRLEEEVEEKEHDRKGKEELASKG